MHPTYRRCALLLAAFSLVGDCTPTECGAGNAPDCMNAFASDEMGSLSLLQHSASLTKKAYISSESSRARENSSSDAAVRKSASGLKDASYNAWIMAPYTPENAPWPNPGTAPIMIITPPLAYRLTLGIISILVIVVICAFFITERKRRVDDGKPSAEAILWSKNPPKDRKILQDYLEKMTDLELNRDFIIPVDKRERLTFRRLKDFIKSKDADLSRFGISGKDRIATILGDGPETAVAFWAFSAQCSFCPVNHKATNEEIDFLLNDLTDKASYAEMKGVVLYKEDEERVKGFSTIFCTRDKRFGGLFSLSAKEEQSSSMQNLFSLSGKEESSGRKVTPTKDDIALVIQTSGTTKKPKMVPLSHENLILCANAICQMIELHHEDRSLNFLPLFHIGGIANNVISPVISKSSVITAEDFTGEKAFGWVVDHEPTWYYGSPTTHILMMRDHETPKTHRLRLIRNATAALLPTVAEEMDNFWNCEILPGYGMSECTPIASHRVRCKVKLDCVGPAIGPEVKISDTNEICIRGKCVFKGYEVRDHMAGENPNDSAFFEDKSGWFRTGDCGIVDEETAYYKITGRAKEIIIRGGENISPFEVEDQVQDPKVKEKAVFAVQHKQLGEVVALAVVTDVPGEECGALLKSLKKAANLDPRKLPEIIIKVDALPKNNLKKVKRMDLQKQVQKLLEVRDMNSSDPIAYYFVPPPPGTTENGALTEYEDEDDEDDQAEAIDSLGLTKGKGGVQIPPDVKDVIMAMYAMAAFGVVAYHGQIFLLYPSWTSTVGQTLVHMMCGNVIGGMRWTMQCFMACASYLQCKEPFSLTRVVILIILYFGYEWPISYIISGFAVLASNEPSEAWYVMTDKRWFVGVMIFSYCSFAFFRHYEKTHGLQCAFWVVVTLLLNFFPVNNSALSNIMPEFINFWFQDVFVCGLFVWSGCVMGYFIVGYYGHSIIERVLAHPWAHDHKFQRGLVQCAPFIYLIVLFALFYGPQAGEGIDLERMGYTWKWDPLTVILDQIVAIGMIAILSQTVRSFSGWIKNIGACSLGIYLGGDIIFYCPKSSNDKLGASFGIIIDQYEVIPTLQRTVFATAGFWPAMVLAVFVYTCFQIFVFGLPFHWCYLKFINFCEFASNKLKLKKMF